MSQRGYRPQYTEKLALNRRLGKIERRISGQIWQEIEADLSADFSPEQITGKRALEGKQTVSVEWIYQHIYQDKAIGGNLYLPLRCQRKRKKGMARTHGEEF